MFGEWLGTYTLMNSYYLFRAGLAYSDQGERSQRPNVDRFLDSETLYSQILCIILPSRFCPRQTFYLSTPSLERIHAFHHSHLPSAFNILLTLILCVGIRESRWTNNFINVLRLFIIILFTCAGIKFINPANWTPFVPPAAGDGD